MKKKIFNLYDKLLLLFLQFIFSFSPSEPDDLCRKYVKIIHQIKHNCNDEDDDVEIKTTPTPNYIKNMVRKQQKYHENEKKNKWFLKGSIKNTGY